MAIGDVVHYVISEGVCRAARVIHVDGDGVRLRVDLVVGVDGMQTVRDVIAAIDNGRAVGTYHAVH